jgi:uroporphyrinogen III methyltransferase/synthase
MRRPASTPDGEDFAGDSTPVETPPASGRAYLVGAGPGDPGLLTARALELIAAADVILYDRLIPSAALDGARADAELLFVGKGGGESVPQAQTEALIVQRARAGRTVVRLKGGDPFVFGRGGEEALALRAAGIPYEIVPGVSAGVAAPAYAGIPVTHRGSSSAVAFVTGHLRAGSGPLGDAADQEGAPGDAADTRGEAPASASPDDGNDGDEEPGFDWAALAAFPGTLVLYMSVRRLAAIAAALIDAGRPASEPVAVIERGTLPAQRTVVGTLATIAERARAADVRAPAIAVVGPVAALAEQLAWLDPRPLAGLSVAVTRARAQASELARRLQELGARVVQAPVIRLVPLPGPAPDLAPYDLVCLTSPVGVATLFERLARGAPPRDARAFAGKSVAAIGPGTADALAGRGIVADIVPERSVAEALVEALADVTPPVRRALIARASEGRDVLPDALRARGAQVDVLALYETIADAPPAHVLREALLADYTTFTSSSTVRFFLQAAAAGSTDTGSVSLSPDTRIVSIGPVTSEALREHGLQPHVEAQRHDIDGLVDALLADAAGRRRASELP